MKSLTEARIRRLDRPGRYAAGEVRTLYLIIDGRNGERAKRWIQRVTINGQRTDLGLGAWPVVTLQDARDAALDNLRAIRRGDDPRRPPTPLFRAACEKSDTTTGRTADARQSALDTYCQRIMNRPVDTIGREDVLGILTPIWSEKHNTAKKLRGWMRGALSWAQAHGHVEHNYAGEIVDGALRAPAKTADEDDHHAALPFADLPACLESINGAAGLESTKDALAFVILTAVRSGEAREARWNEIDFDARVWTIPASRMKARRAHQVPLSDAAVALLERRRGESEDDGYVFPGRTPGQPLSRKAMSSLLSRINPDITVHGFRSTFRDWAGETTTTPREVLEHCLAHRVGNAVEQAYARGTLLDRRRRVMDAWADFATGQATGTVVAFRAG